MPLIAFSEEKGRARLHWAAAAEHDMSTIEETTRRRLALSIHLIESHKDQLIAAIEAPLRTQEPPHATTSQAATIAELLTGLLLAQARNLVNAGTLAVADRTAADHQALGISGRHYSRYGDVLVPVLRDVIGANLPTDIAAAWGDLFWAAVAATRPARAPEPIMAERHEAFAPATD
jgi:nitric oxide dioxygenase/hemoglobin